MNLVGAAAPSSRYTLPAASSDAKPRCRKAASSAAPAGAPAAAWASSAAARNSMHVIWRCGAGGSRAVIHGSVGTTHAIDSTATPIFSRR